MASAPVAGRCWFRTISRWWLKTNNYVAPRKVGSLLRTATRRRDTESAARILATHSTHSIQPAQRVPLAAQTTGGCKRFAFSPAIEREMTRIGELMNQTEYAKARGVNPAIFSAVQRGLIHLTAHGQVDVDQADGAWFRRHSEQREKHRGTVEAEARREQAVTQATAAKLVMTRRKVDQLRDTTVERDRSQAEIGTAIADTKTELGDAPIEDPIRKAIAEDLGNLEAVGAWCSVPLLCSLHRGLS
jgi:hypothetical protein